VPNPPVDVNSRGGSACYPRGTFYPLSDGPATQNHRITRPCFRTCSTRRSRSQAPFCPCALRHDYQPCRGNLRAPPLLFGRRPPQSNCPPGNVPKPAQGPRLESQQHQGGISPLAPGELTPPLQSLPPILHKHCRNPMPGYSKGPRGLSVPLRVSGIFTAVTTSPSTQSRQRPSRYTIRAGRNLPDKEFRSVGPAPFPEGLDFIFPVLCSCGK
jgi:hypothetical protein